MHKLGKQPATSDHRDLRLASYLDAKAALPSVPKRFGFGKMFPNFGMLGNDEYGDCVFAGAAHEHMIWTHLGRNDAAFTTPYVLADYSAVTGFDPSDPATDQGANVREALKYRQKQGIQDGHGRRHQIEAYVALDPKDWQQLLVATYLFGAVGIGFEFPESAWQQFDDGEPWDIVEPNEAIIGGHYVPVVGSMDSTTKVTCVTWGKRQELTENFYVAYNDEAWALLSHELIRPDGRGIHNFDWEKFQADFAAL